MLLRKNRLSRKEFGLVLGSRVFANGTHFLLKKGLDSSVPKIAVSVSKKVSKSSVTRNKIRRRVYSTLRPLIGSLSGTYLFTAKKGAEKIKGEDLKEEVTELLNKLKKG